MVVVVVVMQPEDKRKARAEEKAVVGGMDDALFAVMLALPRCHGNKTRQPRVKRDRVEIRHYLKLPSPIAMARPMSVSAQVIAECNLREKLQCKMLSFGRAEQTS